MGDDVDLDEPVGYLTLPKGTPVVGSDGVQVGTVHTVQHHVRERFFDGLVVQGIDARRFVDAPEVGYMTRRRVELEITSAEFHALPVIGGTLGALDSGVRRVARRLPWRRHRS